MRWVIFILITGLCFACNGGERTTQGDWIKGSPQEQIEMIERQFRGFDMAMVETGYRYQELYWAGEDENWEYAGYQVEKIRLAIENGLERRPKREASAQSFLNTSLPEIERAIQERDTLVFDRAFQALTVSCNSCHAMEKVSHFMVKEPLTRPSPIRKQ